MNQFEKLFNFVRAFLSISLAKVAHSFERMRAMAYAVRVATLAKAYAVWSGRGLLIAQGFGTRRAGSGSVKMAIEIIIITLIIGISGFFVATTIPPALTIIATAALVSVSGAVASLLQTVLSIAIVGTIIMLYVAVIYHVVTSVSG